MKGEFTQRPLLVDVNEEIVVCRLQIGLLHTIGNGENIIFITRQKFASNLFDKNGGFILRVEVNENNIICGLSRSCEEGYDA